MRRRHLLNLVAMFVFDKDQDVCLQFLAQAHFIASSKNALDLGRFTWSASVEQSIDQPIINQSINENSRSINQLINQSMHQSLNE